MNIQKTLAGALVVAAMVVAPFAANAQNKPVIVITGASSGIGLYTLLGAISAGYFPIGACRYPDSCMQMLLEQHNLNSDDFSLLQLDLTEHESVITFSKRVKSI